MRFEIARGESVALTAGVVAHHTSVVIARALRALAILPAASRLVLNTLVLANRTLFRHAPTTLVLGDVGYQLLTRSARINHARFLAADLTVYAFANSTAVTPFVIRCWTVIINVVENTVVYQWRGSFFWY